MTQPPSQDKIDVAIQTLRDDAQKWRAAAGELELAARTAGEMDFQAFHFSYIGDKIGITESYRLLQDKMIELLNGGAANFRNVAQALTISADGYQEDDRNAVHRLKGVW
jgi:hypothetical protein